MEFCTYFVINYHFYCTVNPNPKFIAENIKLFRWAKDNKYKILKLKTRTFYLRIFLFYKKGDIHRSTSAHKLWLLKIQVYNLSILYYV